LVAFMNVCAILWAAMGLTEDIEIRRYLLGRIERLAVAFEVGLPRIVNHLSHPGEPSITEFYKIAADVRSLKTWIAFPQLGTAEELSERVALIGGALASNMYYYVIPEGAANITLTQIKFRSRGLTFLRTVGLGFLPAAGLLVVKAAHVELSQQVSSAWTLASVLWIVVSVLASQPDFKEKLAATRDTMSLITKSPE
jgi:hypothetical protein